MTDPSSPDVTAPHEFETGEGLRSLLIRLTEAGPGSWRHDTEAHELAKFTARKYARLARKYDLDPWEAVTAAFETMRKPGTLRADNPWAVITEAVRLACIYEQRGHGLLCSSDKARKAEISMLHDPKRFADTDQEIIDWHPALRFTDPRLDVDDEELPAPVVVAVEHTVALFVLLGWTVSTARGVIDYVCETLARLGNRASAVDVLCRDQQARALLDIPKKSWMAAVKVLLGNPNPAYAATQGGRGLLMRFVVGETLAELLNDDTIVRRVSEAAPSLGGAP